MAAGTNGVNEHASWFDPQSGYGYNPWMMNPFAGTGAALFDLDGTLVETHIDFPMMRREIQTLAERYGVDSRNEDAPDALSLLEWARGELVSRGMPDEALSLRAEAFNRLEEIETAQCASPVMIPGASELVASLIGAGIRVGIVTRNCRRVALRLIDAAELHCCVLMTRDDVPRTKPDPAHLLAALDAMDATGPDAVMVGDHWMDVMAGRAAGLRTIGIHRNREPGFFAPAMPDLLARDIAELLPLVPQDDGRRPECLNL